MGGYPPTPRSIGIKMLGRKSRQSLEDNGFIGKVLTPKELPVLFRC